MSSTEVSELTDRLDAERLSVRDATVPEPRHPLTGRPWLGVELRAVPRGQAGVLVGGVLRGSPAFEHGLEAGDVLLSLGGESVNEPEDVHRAVQSHRPGDEVGVVLRRRQRPRLLLVQLGGKPDAEDMVRLNFVGTPAPSFRSVRSVQGAPPEDVSDLEGRVVVLEFWARWCGVCRYVVPFMNRWHRRYRPQGVTVLGLTTDPVDHADRTARELGIEYPIVSDSTGETTAAYHATQIPMLFVIDKSGTVRDVMVGFSERRLQELESLVERLLDEEPTGTLGSMAATGETAKSKQRKRPPLWGEVKRDG